MIISGYSGGVDGWRSSVMNDGACDGKSDDLLCCVPFHRHFDCVYFCSVYFFPTLLLILIVSPLVRKENKILMVIMFIYITLRDVSF